MQHDTRGREGGGLARVAYAPARFPLRPTDDGLERPAFESERRRRLLDPGPLRTEGRYLARNDSVRAGVETRARGGFVPPVAPHERDPPFAHADLQAARGGP